MAVRTLILTAALLGGASWVANLYVDAAALSVVGAVLLGLAVLLVGARLAGRAWLRVVAAAGALLLAWSVLGLVRDGVADDLLEAVVGGAASLLVAIAVARGPRSGPVGESP